MIAAGLTPEETKHNSHRRAFFHDYNRPGLYMITLVTEARQRLFGCIVGHSRGMRGTPDYPHLQCSALGAAILQQEVRKITQFYPMVEVCKVALMPDHIHLLVNVRKRLPQGKHLGTIVRGFKTGCTRAWWKQQDETAGKTEEGPAGGTPATPAGETAGTVATATPPAATPATTAGKTAGTVPGVSPSGTHPSGTPPSGHPPAWRPVLFQAGYHDRIIIREGMLENIIRYMDENPFRARLREEHPNLMQRCLHLWINNREYAAFGNLFLLKNPDKIQVFFHRKNAQGIPTHLTSEFAQEKSRLLQRAEEGAVLVTPGISKGEQDVAHTALAEHLPLILLQKEPITDYWKPPLKRFYACTAGRLLILAPWQVTGDSDYARFHSLNDRARDICHATDTRLINI